MSLLCLLSNKRWKDLSEIYYIDTEVITGFFLLLINNKIICSIDFYEVMVDEAKGRINYHLIEIKSE